MTLRSAMVRFFTLCPMTSVKSSKTIFPHQCLVITKGKLVPMMQYNNPSCRTFAEDTGESKEPEKEEEVEKIKMPGFVYPQTQNEEGYFTQKAHQQLEELKKKMGKPSVDNTERKE